jgi:hypothetical protein
MEGVVREPVAGDDVIFGGVHTQVVRVNDDGTVDLPTSDPANPYGATIARQVPYDASGTMERSWRWPDPGQ